MSVQIVWDNSEKTIIRFIFEGKWTWEEFYPAHYKAIDMVKSVPYRVNVIVDMRKGVSTPANVLMHIKNISDKQPPNVGLSVIVTTSSFIHSLYQIGVKFYHKIGYYFSVADNLEAAYVKISQAETAKVSESK